MRVFIALFALIATIGVDPSGVCAQAPASAQVAASPEQQAIHANAKAFVEAFNRADAKAIADLFAENSQMSVDGETVADGRPGVEKAYAGFFAANPDKTISVTIDSIKQVGPNLAIEKGSSVITSSDQPVLDAYTLVHTKQNQQWLIASASVVQQVIEPEFDWKQELSVLEGRWVARKDDWQVDTTIEWVAGGNFLKRSFQVTNGQAEESSGVQLIGWDPREAAVTSWTFSSGGGYSRGWWTRDEDNWIIESEGITAGGESIWATNIITMLGDDHFRWQSTRRSIDGVDLEDTESIRVRRVTDQP